MTQDEDGTYESHYQEKALAPNQELPTRLWGMGIVDEVKAERTYDAHGGIGAQTPQESRHINNLKKERPWQSKRSRNLPPWMRR